MNGIENSLSTSFPHPPPPPPPLARESAEFDQKIDLSFLLAELSPRPLHPLPHSPPPMRCTVRPPPKEGREEACVFRLRVEPLNVKKGVFSRGAGGIIQTLKVGL